MKVWSDGGSRQLEVAEVGGREPKTRETARKRSAGAVDDQNWSRMTSFGNEPSQGSRQLEVAEVGGREPKNTRETARKRSAGAVGDQNWSRMTSFGNEPTHKS